MEFSEKVYCFALSRIFRYEPRLAKAVKDTFGSASGVFALSRDELYESMGPYNKYSDAILKVRLDMTEKELNGILSKGFSYITCDDKDFPAALDMCDDGPLGLFVRSDNDITQIFRTESIAIVGTRDVSPYGKDWCRLIVDALGNSDVRPSIISGMAYGVDICAHIAALEQGLPTIAVLGTGIDKIYPARHECYADRICRHTGSAVISEFPPDTEVTGVNFLSRNRIIAGLSKATVLIESKVKGGGMTTAKYASSYGRDVFALPGRNDDQRSQGCNLLIRSHIAEPLTDSDSFLEYLGYSRLRKTREECFKEYVQSGKERPQDIGIISRILLLIRSNSGISVEKIAELSGIPIKEVLSVTTRLESDGMISVDLQQRCRINSSGDLRER